MMLIAGVNAPVTFEYMNCGYVCEMLVYAFTLYFLDILLSKNKLHFALLHTPKKLSQQNTTIIFYS